MSAGQITMLLAGVQFVVGLFLGLGTLAGISVVLLAVAVRLDVFGRLEHTRPIYRYLVGVVLAIPPVAIIIEAREAPIAALFFVAILLTSSGIFMGAILLRIVDFAKGR